MSRYRHEGDGRREPERWDPERFNRERGGRQQILERDIYEEHDRFVPAPRRPQKSFDDFDYPPPPGRRGERFEEKDHFFAEERYGPPARRAARQERYYEEEEIDSFEESPDRGGGRMMPFDRGLPARRAPPRPGIIRRQSSLDTFDRKPRYPREPPEVIKMPAPARRRRSPPRYEREVEDIRIAEPDYYGDEGFRGYKEREIITDRIRRGPSPLEEKETFTFEEEAPFPRRGKTRMPGRLVNTRAIIELGYPFEQDGETVVILKALGKDQIDEVISVSKEMNRGANRTTYMIEAPPPAREEIVERREIVIPAQAEPNEVPRSVREWDAMSGAIGGGHSEHGGGHSSHGGKSTHGGKSAHGGKSTHGGKSHSGKSHGGKSHGGKSHAGHHSTKGGGSESESSSSSTTEVIIEHKHSRSKSRHRSKSVGHGTPIEEVGESNPMRNGPLALVLPHRDKEANDRDERSIKVEIKALEAEKRRLKHERELEKDHRKSSRYRSHDDEDEVIIERRENTKERDVRIEKDRKGNMAFVR